MVVMFMPTSVMAEGSFDTGGGTSAAELQSGSDQESGGSEAGSGNNSGEAEEGQQTDSEVAQPSEVKTETPAETTGKTGDDVGESSNEGGSSESTRVARIERTGTEYSDIDVAIAAAESGDMIILLANVEPKETFYKSLTFRSEGTNFYSVTYDVVGWRYSGDLTFDHAKFVVNSDSGSKKADNPEAPRWVSMVFRDAKLKLTNGAAASYSFDSNFDSNKGVKCAIYTDERVDSSIIVENGSSFSVHGRNTKGIDGQGVQLGNTANCKISVTGGSDFLIDGCNRGYVNSPTVEVNNSTFTVQNCSANASNGGTFTAVDSTVNFLNNGGHGLSAGDALIQKSTLTSTGNGYTGIHIGGNLEVIEGSKVTARGNGWNGWDADRFAGLRINGNGELDSKSSIDIENNYEVGMRIEGENSNVDLSAGSVTIRDNGIPNIGSFQNKYYSWDKSSREGKFNNTKGGGIWNKGTLLLPENAAVYNNHAEKAGDDIYSTGTVTFGKVGSGWTLDAGANGGGRADASGKVTGIDCRDDIDGWYDDTELHRWEAHWDGKFHTQEVKEGTHAGTVAVKAAHGITYSNVTPDIPEDWSHSKSKTATNLDSKFNSTITLSVPSAEVPIATDVVFVLDKSTSGDVKDRIIRMLSDLQQSIDNSGATVKVGVVVFNKEAKQVLSLTELTKNNKGVIEDAVRSGLKSGTNLHAGILAGTEMLDKDTSVDNGRKYLILVSDGITYMYNSNYNSNPTAINSENGDRTNAFAGPDIWSVKYDSNEVTESWDSYLGRAKDQIEADGSKYDIPYGTGTYPDGKYISYDTRKHHAMTVDKALYNSYVAYVDAASKYHTYALTAESGSGSQYLWGPSFMRYLNEGVSRNKGNINFDNIKKEIYYVVGSGSSITDVIGYGTDDHRNDYDFQFVNDIDKIKIVYGGEELEKKEISANTYGFGTDSSVEEGYMFILHYHPKETENTSEEQFTVDCNVPVTLKDKLQIVYDVHLNDPQTASGTYGKYDKDGSKGYDSLKTNKEAVLHPIDSNGKELTEEKFPEPTVSYTVSPAPVTPVTPDAPAATLSVRKVWKLDDGGTKPASINVVITRNGRAYTETLSDANNWTYTETVNTTDVITVTEGAIDGFTASMDISGFDFTITNDDAAPDEPDEPVIPDKPSKPTKPSKPSKPSNGGTPNAAATKPAAVSAKGPKTGDDCNVLLYGGIFALAAAGIAVIIWRRRRAAK
ncbi:MAG: VWA domain-containing protein [Eubacteriales bacterium]|nr:VWA domain-containing protein [Eubacteriales bacterium]